MYIIRLRPAQIVKVWDSLRFAIAQSIAPLVTVDEESMRVILSELLCEKLQCWCIYEKTETGIDIYGYAVTSIQVEPHTNVKTLLIYAYYMFKKIDETDRADLHNSMEVFARNNNCKLIAGYTSNPLAGNIAKKLNYHETNYYVKEV